MEYGIEIKLLENQIHVLIAESPSFLSKLIETLYKEKQDGDGKILLSENDKILSFSKMSEIIVNPFTIDPNERRIMQKLYQELCAETLDQLVIETGEIHAKLISYLEEISLKVPYHVTFDLEENIPNLLKAYNVRLETESSNLLERIVEYLKLLHQLCRIEVVFFVNLKTYLRDEDLEQLYQFAFYEKNINYIIRKCTKNETELRKNMYYRSGLLYNQFGINLQHQSRC